MFAQLARIFKINQICIRHNLDELIYTIPWFRPFAFLFYLAPWNWTKRKKPPLPVRIRRGCEDLGPIFIKFGQMLSTRPDLLPSDLIAELSKLQDNVAPFPSNQAVATIEDALGGKVADIFATFDSTPLASASIAQVHAATLQNGDEVVVKVLRPNVEQNIQADLRLMHTMARLFEKYIPQWRRFHPREVVEEYDKTISNELDLMREAANASQLRRNFLDSPVLYVPKVYWDYCHTNVMVMERIHGIPVNDIEQLKEAGVNLKKLSETGVEIFFTQVFRDNFFHADMHPGNIMVSPHHPDEPRYLGVDFGIVGTLAAEDQYYLAANFLAFFNNDYRRVAELHIRSGWVPEETRVDELEAAIRTVCEPIFQQPLSRISFGVLLMRLFRVARQFNMEVQPQLVLLQKTLLNIEGLGRQIYPDLDLWDTAKPFLERWMRNHNSPRVLLPKLLARVPEVLEKLANGEIGSVFSVPPSAPQDSAYKKEVAYLRKEVSVLRWSLIAATLIVLAGAVILVLLA